MGLKINEKVGAIRGRVILTLTDVKTGKKDVQIVENLFVDSGKEAIAARLADDTAKINRGVPTFGAVGTGTSVPALLDTTLETEIFRKVLATTIFSGNQTTLRLFLSTTQGNGVLKEFGIFGEDATSAPDSGTMFNRVNINRTKTASNTLTIEVIFTLG